MTDDVKNKLLEEFHRFWWNNIPEATKEGEYLACKSFLSSALSRLESSTEKRVKEAERQLFVASLNAIEGLVDVPRTRPNSKKDITAFIEKLRSSLLTVSPEGETQIENL